MYCQSLHYENYSLEALQVARCYNSEKSRVVPGNKDPILLQRLNLE